MTYKATIGGTTLTVSYSVKSLFDYCGLKLKDIRGHIGQLIYHEVATVMVFIHDPRFQRELYLRENEKDDLDDAKKFITWLFEEISKHPGEVVDIRFIKEGGFDNPEGV